MLSRSLFVAFRPDVDLCLLVAFSFLVVVFCFLTVFLLEVLSSRPASKQKLSSCIPVGNLLPVCRHVDQRATGSLFCLQNFKTWIYDVINSCDCSSEMFNDDVNTGLFSSTFYSPYLERRNFFLSLR